MSHEFGELEQTWAKVAAVLAQNPQAQAIVHAAYEAPTNSVDASSRLVVEDDDGGGCALCAELTLKGDGKCGECAMEEAEARQER